MEEFRSNLLLLLHCRYPQGMLLDKLEEEYERYFQKRVKPYLYLNESPGSWRNVVEKTYLHNDLKVFEINSTLYVKPVGIRSETEMMLIAKLAKYSHFHFAQDTFFQLRDCTCCASATQQQQQIYTGFTPAGAINHYSTTGSSALSTAAAVAAVSNQYTANALQQQQQQSQGEQFRVQYVTTQGALQGATALPAGSITATNLSMNGAVKYERFDEQTLRASTSGDYYIMLQGTQNQPIRYDTIGNLTSPPLQTHRTTDGSISSAGIVYATTPQPNQQPQQQQQQQQPQPQQQQQSWNFSRTPETVNVAQPQTSTSSTTSSTPAPPKAKGRGKAKAAAGTGAKGKKSAAAAASTEKQFHYCRWEGCKKSFRRFKLLENHERLAHLQDGDDNLTCSTVGCKQRFQDKKQLQHHESRCELKPHRCSWEGCDKTFRTSKLLHGHISAVHRRIGRNTYKCTIPGCAQAYPDSTKLKTHEIRCRFRYDTLRDIDNEKEAADALALAQGGAGGIGADGNGGGVGSVVVGLGSNSLDVSGATVSSASNLTTSSVSSGGGGPSNDDPMNMSMSGNGEDVKPSTVDLSSFLKNEVGEEQCFVTQNPI